MGKKQPSWKQLNEGPSQQVRRELEIKTVQILIFMHLGQDRVDEYFRIQEAARAQNKNIALIMGIFCVIAACGYQYTLATMAASQTAGKSAIEGVTQDGNGFTSLHRAAEKSVEAVKELFPDPGEKAINVPDKWNETPIAKAAKKGRHTTVQFLLDHGADPNVISVEVRSPLYHALFETQGLDTAKVLIAGKADVNVTLNDNKSLLHEACRYHLLPYMDICAITQVPPPRGM
jgi:hypothetical protein